MSRIVFAVLLLFASFAIAADTPAPAAAASSQGVPWTNATIKKIAGNRVTLAHDRIQNLGMDAMTMQFMVRDTAGLAKLKAGEKVRFQVISADGDYVVVRIEAAR